MKAVGGAGGGTFQLPNITLKARVPFDGNKKELAKREVSLPPREIDKRWKCGSKPEWLAVLVITSSEVLDYRGMEPHIQKRHLLS